jgi:NAD(P)-dependent dehydrogenase (short-subunit alcohol dehydrogenase family)
MTMSLAGVLAPAIRGGCLGTQPDGDADDRDVAPAAVCPKNCSNPLKRIGQPEKAASVILGLATTMTFVNGTVIPVDGDSLS